MKDYTALRESATELAKQFKIVRLSNCKVVVCRDGVKQSWSETATPQIVIDLIDEIERLRGLATRAARHCSVGCNDCVNITLELEQ